MPDRKFLIGVAAVFILLIIPADAAAQRNRHTISGIVTDASTGELLISALVSVPATGAVARTNAYGFYSLSLSASQVEIEVSHMGYSTFGKRLDLTKNIRLDVALEPAVEQLEKAEVVAERGGSGGTAGAGMSASVLSSETIRKMPALMGETDPLKALHLLPGVQPTMEGSSGFSVRGGGYDQNQILMDDATVYSASHLMGFFSIFNNDALKDIRLYKGDIPAPYGGRISSLVDVRTRDGNNNRFGVNGGIGTISSRLTLEGPLAGDRSTFIISGRRTYADMFLKMSSDENIRSSSLYFYDLNAKLNYRIDGNNRVYAAGYMGRDHMSASTFGMRFGNRTGSLRWNHIFSPRVFSNLSLVASGYDYFLKYDASNGTGMEWNSRIGDYGFKADVSYYANPGNTWRFGYNLTYHDFAPGEGGGIGEDPVYARIYTARQHALEHALFLSGESDAGPFSFRYGLRLSAFQNVSNGDTVTYLKNYAVDREVVYPRGKFYKTQSEIEPRLGATWRVDGRSSVKGSYTRSAQYIQLASNSAAGSPLDVWFQATQNVRPQICDQYALGYFRSLGKSDGFELSVEVYYKNLRRVVDFRDHARLLANADLEQEFRFGRGWVYGAEVMLSKNTGNLTGWIGYDLCKSLQQVDGVNEGRWYRSRYDKPVNLSVALAYELSGRWSLQASWVYSSGTPVTYPTGRYLIENTYVPIYSGRNEYRYPDYHRLDLGATLLLSDPSRRLHSELNFSLYNAYGRKNPWTIIFGQEKSRPDVSYAEMIYLFTFVPSITWNFKF